MIDSMYKPRLSYNTHTNTCHLIDMSGSVCPTLDVFGLTSEDDETTNPAFGQGFFQHPI